MRIVVPAPIDSLLEAHLSQGGEQLAFMGFHQDGEVLQVDDLLVITADLLHAKDRWHVELSEAGQKQVLVWANERGSGLIEIHTHGGLWPAEFSSIDLCGLAEWAPNMVWRLGGRPYGALVVAGDSIDGLLWTTVKGRPEAPSAVERSGESQPPTGLSLLRVSEEDA